MNWSTALLDTTGQVLWEELGDEEHDDEQESNKDEDGEEEGDQVHLDVGQGGLCRYNSCRHRLYESCLFRFDRERVELGGEGAGNGGVGKVGVGLEDQHWADVEVGLRVHVHVHAAAAVGEEGEKEKEEICKLGHLRNLNLISRDL